MKEVVSISLIGAGLVILGLIMLWFLMDILVRITSEKKKPDAVEGEKINIKQQSNTEYLQKAAAASTAVAIALLKTSFMSSDEGFDQRLTAWQTAHRYQQLHNWPNTPFADRNNK